MDNPEIKPIELCRTTKHRKTPYGSASRNYYGELRRFRGYRGPLKKDEEKK
jgi:hypothetical protein